MGVVEATEQARSSEPLLSLLLLSGLVPELLERARGRRCWARQAEA